MENFLDKLNENVLNSLISFEIIKEKMYKNNNGINFTNFDNLANKIQMVTDSLEKYKQSIHELEEKYFHDDDNQFVLSFDNEQSKQFQPYNFIDTYKKVLSAQITKHKYLDAAKKTNTKKTNTKKTNAEQTNTKPIQNTSKILTDIDGIDLQNNTLNLPVIDNLQNLSPAFHWYDGDKYYKKGIYICLCKGFYIKVPFPNVLSGASKDYKLNSVKCKYTTLQECQLNKKKISEIHNSDMRECYFVHKKEKFNKVSSLFKCSIESLGNHETLDDDLERVQNFDIKHLLMYSLSDDLLAILWYQNKFKDSNNLVFTNLDTF